MNASTGKKSTKTEQELGFLETPTQTTEVANKIRDEELQQAPKILVDNLTKGDQQKESDSDIFLDNKASPKISNCILLSFLPKKSKPNRRSTVDNMQKYFSNALIKRKNNLINVAYSRLNKEDLVNRPFIYNAFTLLSLKI